MGGWVWRSSWSSVTCCCTNLITSNNYPKSQQQQENDAVFVLLERKGISVMSFDDAMFVTVLSMMML